MAYYQQGGHPNAAAPPYGGYGRMGPQPGMDPYAAYERRPAPPSYAHPGYAGGGQMPMQAQAQRGGYVQPGYGQMPGPPVSQQQYYNQQYSRGAPRSAPVPGAAYNVAPAAPFPQAPVPTVPIVQDRKNMLNMEAAKSMAGRNERIIIKIILLQQALDKSGPVPKPQLIERMAKLKAKLHKRLTKMAPWLDLPHSDRAKKWLGVLPVHRTLVLENRNIKEDKARKDDKPAAPGQRRGPSSAYPDNRASQYPGVIRDSRDPSLWQAIITFGVNQQQYLGLFRTDTEAGRAYSLAMEEFGRVGNLNNLLNRFPGQLDAQPLPPPAPAPSSRAVGRPRKPAKSRLKKKKRGEDDDSDYEGEDEDVDSEDSEDEEARQAKKIAHRAERQREQHHHQQQQQQHHHHQQAHHPMQAGGYDAYGRPMNPRSMPAYPPPQGPPPQKMEYYHPPPHHQPPPPQQPPPSMVYRNMPGANPHHPSYGPPGGGGPGGAPYYPSLGNPASYAVAPQYGMQQQQQQQQQQHPQQHPQQQQQPPPQQHGGSMGYLTDIAVQRQQQMAQQHHHHMAGYGGHDMQQGGDGAP